MKIRIVTALFATLFILAWVSCKDKNDNPDYLNEADCTGITADDNTYEKSIKSILNSSCAFAGCHGGGTASNGHDLSTYAGAKKVFQDGPGLCAIHHGEGCEHMPKDLPQLPAGTIKLIDCWAKNGYRQ